MDIKKIPFGMEHRRFHTEKPSPEEDEESSDSELNWSPTPPEPWHRKVFEMDQNRPHPIPQKRPRKGRETRIGQLDGAEENQPDDDPPFAVRRKAISDERRMSSSQAEPSNKPSISTGAPSSGESGLGISTPSTVSLSSDSDTDGWQRRQLPRSEEMVVNATKPGKSFPIRDWVEERKCIEEGRQSKRYIPMTKANKSERGANKARCFKCVNCDMYRDLFPDKIIECDGSTIRELEYKVLQAVKRTIIIGKDYRAENCKRGQQTQDVFIKENQPGIKFAPVVVQCLFPDSEYIARARTVRYPVYPDLRMDTLFKEGRVGFQDFLLTRQYWELRNLLCERVREVERSETLFVQTLNETINHKCEICAKPLMTYRDILLHVKGFHRMEMPKYRLDLSWRWKRELEVDGLKDDELETDTRVTIVDQEGNIEYEGPSSPNAMGGPKEKDTPTQAEELGTINDHTTVYGTSCDCGGATLQVASKLKGPAKFHFSPPVEVGISCDCGGASVQVNPKYGSVKFHFTTPVEAAKHIGSKKTMTQSVNKEAPRGTKIPDGRLFQSSSSEACEMLNRLRKGQTIPAPDTPTGNQSADYIRPRPTRPITGGKTRGGEVVAGPSALTENFHLRNVNLPAVHRPGLEGKLTWFTEVLKETHRSLHNLSAEARITRDLAIKNATQYGDLSDRFTHREDESKMEKDTLVQEVRKLRETDELILQKINEAEAEDAEAVARDENK